MSTHTKNTYAESSGAGCQIRSDDVGVGYYANIGGATQRDPHPVHGGGIDQATAEANARLWAAAPEMFEALGTYRDAVAALTTDAVTKLQSVGLSLEMETARMMDNARRLAVAALAKAQGEAT